MKILVGYTGSKAGKAALDLARVHAKAFNAKIDVVISLNRKAEKDPKKIHEAEQVLEYATTFYEEGGHRVSYGLVDQRVEPWGKTWFSTRVKMISMRLLWERVGHRWWESWFLAIRPNMSPCMRTVRLF